MSKEENTQVADSSPAIRTIIPQQIEESGASDTALTQETAESEKVKFPVTVKHRRRGDHLRQNPWQPHLPLAYP